MNNVIVLGAGRSGTSMVAGTLARAGYYIGRDYIRPRGSNPKGFFEGYEINDVNERILAASLPGRWRIRGVGTRLARALGATGQSAPPLPGQGQGWLMPLDLAAPVRSTSTIEADIAALTAQAPFCFKDPRFCYTLPVWRPYLDIERTVFVCVFRHPAATAASIAAECRSQPYLRGLDLSVGEAMGLWRLMYSHVLERQRRHGRWLFIHYEQMFDRAHLARLAAFTGAEVDETFPDAALARSAGTEDLDKATRAVYGELCALADYGLPLCDNPRLRASVVLG